MILCHGISMNILNTGETCVRGHKRRFQRFFSHYTRTAFALFALLSTAIVSPASAESGFSGMYLQGMDVRIASALGMEEPEGVLIRDLALSGPAALGGVKRGDIIVKYANADIKTFKELVAVAQKTKIGQSIAVTVIRAGKPIELNIKLGKKQEAWKVSKGSVAAIPTAGLTLAAVTPKIRQRFGLRWGATGVLVTLVDTEFADRQVLERGDMIVQVNQQEVWLPKHVTRHYNEARDEKRDRILLLVERLGNFRYLLMPVGAE